MRQSTLVFIVALALFVSVVLPIVIDKLTPPDFEEHQISLSTGQEITCIIYSGYQEGGLSCALNDLTP